MMNEIMHVTIQLDRPGSEACDPGHIKIETNTKCISGCGHSNDTSI